MTDALFLLDSNICIYLLEGRSDLTRDRLQECAPGEVVTSAIVFAEVKRGIDAADHRAVENVERFFQLIAPLPFDQAAADAYTRIPFRRARFDRLIAAHALALDLTIVTANEADFADIPGLRIENWMRP
ncbi:type II toxin-antitoxin system VapC family toxin [Sphingomonas sp. ASY06-1R]|uniref:type II toxin-antitoxin system VapC family toxin n=1 Tax=Sphingomonas sp. ASY06-1R TaxID=3445771 RepID=UPI003FA265C1